MKHEYFVCVAVTVTLVGAAFSSQVRDEQGEALFAAAHQGNIDKIKALLAEGIDVNKSNPAGFTTLHVAAGTGQQKVCAFLLEKGAAINAQGWNNQTPLHWAAMAGRENVVELLLENGADVNVQDNRGRTPLDLAVSKRHDEVVNLIVKHDLESANPPDAIHNVGVTNVSVPSECSQGDDVAVTMRVANYGTFRESLPVKLHDGIDGVEIDSRMTVLGKKWRGKADNVSDMTLNGENQGIDLFGVIVF